MNSTIGDQHGLMQLALQGELPFDAQVQGVLVKETATWLVHVISMIFNDRVLLTDKREYPDSWTAGWCYDKGGAAILAAIAWDPETERGPVGYKKVAADRRP